MPDAITMKVEVKQTELGRVSYQLSGLAYHLRLDRALVWLTNLWLRGFRIRIDGKKWEKFPVGRFRREGRELIFERNE